MEKVEIRPCPFCGGNARITGKDCDFGGHNGKGEKRLKYKIRVICNRCHSTGKPITTDWFNDTKHKFWTFQRGWVPDEFFQKYADKAIEEWNRRTLILS